MQIFNCLILGRKVHMWAKLINNQDCPKAKDGSIEHRSYWHIFSSLWDSTREMVSTQMRIWISSPQLLVSSSGTSVSNEKMMGQKRTATTGLLGPGRWIAGLKGHNMYMSAWRTVLVHKVHVQNKSVNIPIYSIAMPFKSRSISLNIIL